MIRMIVLTEWVASGGGYSPALDLPAGCSATDVTGQPPDHIAPSPNSVTWEVWCPDEAAADLVAAQVEHVVCSEEVPDGQA